MEIVVNLLVWLLLTLTGVALASFVGHDIGMRSSGRTLYSFINWSTVALLGWLVTTALLISYRSQWYWLSVCLTVGYLWLCASGSSTSMAVEEEKKRLEKHQEQIDEHERLVILYEDLLISMQEGEFMPESSLPVAKDKMAVALQDVYSFRLMQLNVKFTDLELTISYAALSQFIKDKDAIFINGYLRLLKNRTEAVKYVRENPDSFAEQQDRVKNIFKSVNEERERFDEDWDTFMAI